MRAMVNKIVRTAAAAVLLCLPLWTALAGPFADGLNAAAAGNYAVALALWRPLADEGDAAAQFKLGRLYLNGKGVEKDYEQAANWLRKAALQGHAGAQSNLGALYSRGEGVAKDYPEAAAWLRKAADQGHPVAQFELGLLYVVGGGGIPQDYTEAVVWIRKAADQGYPLAQFNLGQLYFSGRGVPQNTIESFKWLELAAAEANGGDKVRREASKSRRRVAAKMSAEHVAAAQKLAREWQPTPVIAIEQDDS